MFQKLQSLERRIRPPDFEDPDKNRQAFYIQAIVLVIIFGASIIGILYALVGYMGYVSIIILCIIVQGVVIAAIHLKKLQFAFGLFLGSLLALLTLGLMYAGGIHSTSSVLFPVIIISASLLLNRRSFIFYCLCCVASIAIVILAENQKITVPYVPDPPEFPLFFTYSLMVLASAAVIRFLTESLQNNLQKSRQNVRELAAQKAMLDNVGQAILACDTNNTILYWNQAATNLFGWTADETLGRKSSEIVPAQRTPKASEAIRAALARGEAWTGEMRVPKRDGGILPVIGSIAPLYDESGLAGWIAIATDLTSREHAERLSRRRAEEMSLLYQVGVSLTAGKDLYATLLALQTEIIKLIQADAFFVAIYDPGTDLVSYPIFFDEGTPMAEPERRLSEQPGLTGAVIFDGKTLYLPDLMTEGVEETYHPHDSNPDLILHTFLGVPLQVNERVIGMLSVQSKEVDAYSPEQIALIKNLAILAAASIEKARLLEQLQLELAERKRAEEKFRDIFNHSIDGIFQSTEDGRFLNVNPAMARLYGYASPEEMTQDVRSIADQVYVNAEEREEVRRRLNSGERLIGYEMQDYRKDGSIFWTSMSVQAIRDEAGNIQYYEGTIEDISARKTVEAERDALIRELESKNTELERFTYTVSHDLKSPLVTISGFLGYIEQDAQTGDMERLRKDIRRIQDAVNNMQGLLNELLELSRVGRIMNPPEAVAFESLVSEALELMRGPMVGRGVTVEAQSGLPEVRGDRRRLVQVLQNLLENAIKYSGANPSPRVEIGERGEEQGMPVFYVKDNGIGIAPEYHEKVFGLFNKLDPKSEGAGVGLALVKRIIEIHGGRIWVESEAGAGASFFFTLPRA